VGASHDVNRWWYILDDDGDPVPVDDVATWARWYETHDRVVAKTDVEGALVSTVFLSLDHAFMTGPPVLYETMIFGGPFDNYQWRHRNRHEALAAHDQIVTALQRGDTPPEAR
jgi:hypothetical protein